MAAAMPLGSFLLPSHGGDVSEEILGHLDAEDIGPTASVSKLFQRALFGDGDGDGDGGRGAPWARNRNRWRSLAETSCSPGLVWLGGWLERLMIRQVKAAQAENPAIAAWRQTLLLGRSASDRIASTELEVCAPLMLDEANVRDPDNASSLLGDEHLVRVDFHSARYDSRTRADAGPTCRSPISLFFEPSELTLDSEGMLTIPAIRKPAAEPARAGSTNGSDASAAATMGRIAANEAAYPNLIDLLEMSSTTDESGDPDGSDLRLLVYIIHLPTMRQHVLYDGGGSDFSVGFTDEAWVGASFEGLAINAFMQGLMDVGTMSGHDGGRAGGDGRGGTLQSLVYFQVDAMIGRTANLCCTCGTRAQCWESILSRTDVNESLIFVPLTWQQHRGSCACCKEASKLDKSSSSSSVSSVWHEYDLKFYFSMTAVNHRDGQDDDRLDCITRMSTIRWLLRRGLGIV